MRTIDQTVETTEAADRMPTRGVFRLPGLSALLSIVRYRRIRNSTEGLDVHQLRDIGLTDGHTEPYDGKNRAARQDARLREARAAAMMMAMGLGGR